MRHELPAPPDVVFALLVSPEFRAEVDARLRLDKTLLEEQELEDGPVHRWKIVERGEKPAFLEKMVGGSFEYTLEHRVSRLQRRVSWRVTPSIAADRVRAEGVELVEASILPDRAIRVVRGLVEVNAPLVGRKIADYIGGEVQRGYQRSTGFVERYVREHHRRRG